MFLFLKVHSKLGLDRCTNNFWCCHWCFYFSRSTPNWAWTAVHTVCTAGLPPSPTTPWTSWKVLDWSSQRWDIVIVIVFVSVIVLVLVIVMIMYAWHVLELQINVRPSSPADLWNDGEPKQQRQLLQPSARPWKQVAKVDHDRHHHDLIVVLHHGDHNHHHLIMVMLTCTQHPGSNKAV